MSVFDGLTELQGRLLQTDCTASEKHISPGQASACAVKPLQVNQTKTRKFKQLPEENNASTVQTDCFQPEILPLFLVSFFSRVVPTRPQFVQSVPQSVVSPSKVNTWRYPYKVINFDPSCHFYRSWSKIWDKDYVINPEWASEKSLLRPGIASRAKTDLSLRHDLRE